MLLSRVWALALIENGKKELYLMLLIFAMVLKIDTCGCLRCFVARGKGTVVKHLPHHRKFKGFSPCIDRKWPEETIFNVLAMVLKIRHLW